MPSEAQASAVPKAIQIAAQHFEAGRLAEAETACREALQAEPENPHALHLLGLVAFKLGNSELALKSLQEAIRLDPLNAFLHNNLGETYRGLNRLEDAENCYVKALALRPDYSEANANLGLVLHASEKIERSARGYVNLGIALEAAGRVADAERSYRRALESEPDNPGAHLGIGHVLERAGQLAEAEQSARKALALKPDWAEAHHNLGGVLLRLCRLEESERCYRRALEIKPDLVISTFCYSLLLLLRGDYGAGLPLYERRFEGTEPRTVAAYRPLIEQLEATPRWRGEAIPDKTLLLWTEQGLGDSLMAMRYLPLLKQRGIGRLLLYCEPALVRSFRTFPQVDEIVAKDRPLPAGSFDCHCPIMSLPLLFETRLETIPADVPYLRVPAELKSEWAGRLAAIRRPRVGLCWAGNRLLPSDALRSIPLERFAPLFDLEGVKFVSLQKDRGGDQPAMTRRRMLDWMDDCGDLIDTAALIEQLDLVISVDTAVAHLAGALGKPVWLLNRFESEWRWLLEREDSPWYPTMRIFRQRSVGDWDEVIARLAAELRALAGPQSQAKSGWLRRLLAPR